MAVSDRGFSYRGFMLDSVRHFMPVEDLSNMTLGIMVDRLEARGTWKIDLDVSELFSSEWGRAVEMRQNYLRDARQVELKNL